MKEKQKELHTHISEEADRILDKFTKKDSHLFKYRREVIEVALILLDQVFKSDIFDQQIRNIDASKIFQSLTTEAKRKIFINFVKDNSKVLQEKFN